MKRQLDRLQRARAERDQARVDQLLGQLDEAARGDTNLMPLLVECAESYVTLGEMCRVLRGVFGEQREFMVF